MTTIKDYLRDLINDASKLQAKYMNSEISLPDLADEQENLLDEYVEIIKERIVG